MDQLIAYLSARPRARRSLTAAGSVLLAAALILLGYPAITNLLHNGMQGRLSSQLGSASTRSAFEQGTVGEGQALTRIEIPHIGVDVVVVQGVSLQALDAGTGHYPQTPLPCATGNVGVAGHRTTYGKPFANIDRLHAGDQITLVTPVGTCVYRVSRAPFVVLPTDVGVVADTPGVATLTLTACTPKGSASHRIVVRAEMVSSELTA